MEKILFLVDSNGLNKAAFEFACYVATITKSSLTGLFVDVLTDEELAEVKEGSSREPYKHRRLPEGASESLVAEHQRAFALACAEKGIHWLNVPDAVFGSKDVVAETRYADLLIMNPDASLHFLDEVCPSDFTKHILAQTECPVLLAPLQFGGVRQLVFTYDGSASSMYAIKQFTHLFPKLSSLPVTLIQATESDGSIVTEGSEVRQFLKTHYTTFDYHILHGKAANEVFSFLLEKEDALVVMGAYGRSAISNRLRQSTAELVLKTSPLPVFISHK